MELELDEITKNSGKNYAGKITILETYKHSKASEAYVRVEFQYDKEVWKGSVPYDYPRGSVHAETAKEVAEVVQNAYDYQHPEKKKGWVKDAEDFWKGKNAKVTGPIFKVLMDSEWKCTRHAFGAGTNPARRIQDIKDMGFTLATDPNRECKVCKQKTLHHVLLRIPMGASRKYETWSPALRKKIIQVLGNWDVYENRKAKSAVLPDHKFPEARWDEHTSEENRDSMTDDEIKDKFQLMDNRRNEQKREACRNCVQSGIRGTVYGIKFYYKHGEMWPEGIPKRGKEAEEGCRGCGWYDVAKWREELNKKLMGP